MATPSLLLIPDRYKAAKLYSQIPDSGAGDLTFARNSNATRVNSAGLIEKVRTNSILYSEQFDDAYWGKFQATITANSTAAPNGTLTADTITDDANSGSHVIFKTGIWNTTSQTFSIFAKAGTSSRVCILNNSLGTGVFANLADSTIVVDSGFVGTLTAVGSGWFRITAAHTAGSSQTLAIGLFTGTSTPEYVGTGSTAFLWGAQLETGDIATPYIPTTTAAVSVGITANIPRLDYTGGGCPSLLLEPQRTNLTLFSEQFTNAAWINQTSNTTITKVESSTAPDGFAFTRLVSTASGSQGRLVQILSDSATSQTFSLYVRGTGTTQLNLFMTGGGNFASPIITLTNDWQRISVSGTRAIGIGGDFEIRVFGGSTLEVFGAQVEAGSYPTSYIPTLGSSVTRLADAASKTGISSLIGQTAGTVFADLTITKPTSGNADFLLIENAATPLNGVYVLFMDANGQIGFFSYPSAAFGLINAVNYSNQRIKVAYAYSSAGLVIYINGSQVFLDGSVSLGSGLSTFGLNNPGTATISANVSQTLLYPVRLSSAELATLTSL